MASALPLGISAPARLALCIAPMLAWIGGAHAQSVQPVKPEFSTYEDVLVRFDGVPNLETGSVALAPLGWPDDRVKTSWFTESFPGGEANFGSLPPGRYEARLYYSSDQVVRARAAFGVGASGLPTPAGSILASPGALLTRFDMNEDGFLSGKEVRNCGCAELDGNGDGKISTDEMVEGPRKDSGPAMPAQAGTEREIHDPSCVVGEAVEASGIAGWEAGIVTGAADRWGACLVRIEGAADDRRVTAPNLRLPGSDKESPTASHVLGRYPVVPDGAYACMQAGWNFFMERSPLGEIRVTGSSYRNAGDGRLAFDADSQRIDWMGGSLEGYRAVLMQSVDTGKPVIRFAKALNTDNLLGQNTSDVNCFLQIK